MGANAQTSVPTFTAGEVLTAANMNISARTGVPVFASTATRNDAFGGTGEKTLAEGQMCYVEGTGFQTYNGTSWVTWGTAPESPGLIFISSTTIGTAVSSVTVSNVFSATYDNYRIIVSGGAGSAFQGLRIQLGATTTGYYDGYNGYNYTAASANASQTNNGATFNAGSTNTNGHCGNFDLIAPNLAKNTMITQNLALPDSTGAGRAGGGFLNDTTQYTGFTLTTASGTITGGTIKVYGYRN